MNTYEKLFSPIVSFIITAFLFTEFEGFNTITCFIPWSFNRIFNTRLLGRTGFGMPAQGERVVPAHFY